jgi:phage anti-repressor protein
MTELFEVQKHKIGNETVNAVNARDLWEKLKVETKFADWIKRRINEYDFVNGVDFTILKNENGELRGFKPKEYFISLDMAKELSMLENNDAGKIARRYFIDCEKQLQRVTGHLDYIRKLMLLDAPMTWEKIFQDSFFIAIMRLHGHTFNGNKSTPSYCGRIIRTWVYDIVLPQELLFEIDKNQGEEKKHQWFNNGGRSKLLNQINNVEMIAKMSQSRADFEANCARAFLSTPLQLNI